MCLLAYCDHDATPDYAGLEVACINNPDGFGWAVHLGDRIITGRAMDHTVALETYEQALADNPGCASMFHARYATHGTTDLANCHPFTVGGSKGTVLAHNGIISAAPREKDRSDTRWFAEVELPRRGLHVLDKAKNWRKLEQFLGSKVIVFTTEESLKYDIYLLNEHMGDWVDGIWWSNDSYQAVYWQPSSLGAYGALSAHSVIEHDFDGRDVCPACATYLTHDEAKVFGYCLTCETCLDCGDEFGLCLCYQSKESTLTYGFGWDDEDMSAVAEAAVTGINNK